MEQKEIEIWYYAGRVTLQGGKQGVSYARADGREMVFAKKASTAPVVAVVGNPYEVTVTNAPDGGVTLHGKPRLVDMNKHEPHELAGDWKAREVACLEAARMKAAAKKGAADNRLDSSLAYLADCYRRENFGNRVALLAYMIQRITRG